MKKIMKTLIAISGIIAAGIGICALWEKYSYQKEQEKKRAEALEAKRRAEFIARKKARLQKKAAKEANL